MAGMPALGLLAEQHSTARHNTAQHGLPGNAVFGATAAWNGVLRLKPLMNLCPHPTVAGRRCRSRLR